MGVNSGNGEKGSLWHNLARTAYNSACVRALNKLGNIGRYAGPEELRPQSLHRLPHTHAACESNSMS